MDRWDVFLAVCAGYVAVASLVRLMAARRNELVARIREELDRQRPAAPNDGDRRHRDAA